MFGNCATGCTIVSIGCAACREPTHFVWDYVKPIFNVKIASAANYNDCCIMINAGVDAKENLLLQLQQHNEHALAMLMKVYYKELYNYASRFASDEALIKDAIQEVFISLWQRRETATSILSLPYYLLGAVKNRMLKALQKKKNNYDNIQDAAHYQFEVEFSIEKKITEKQFAEERAGNVRSVISNLSPRQREIIYLKFYQQLDHDQIAGLMNISQQSAYNLLHESIQKFKKNWQSKFLMKAC